MWITTNIILKSSCLDSHSRKTNILPNVLITILFIFVNSSTTDPSISAIPSLFSYILFLFRTCIASATRSMWHIVLFIFSLASLHRALFLNSLLSVLLCVLLWLWVIAFHRFIAYLLGWSDLPFTSMITVMYGVLTDSSRWLPTCSFLLHKLISILLLHSVLMCFPVFAVLPQDYSQYLGLQSFVHLFVLQNETSHQDC